MKVPYAQPPPLFWYRNLGSTQHHCVCVVYVHAATVYI